MLRLSIHCSYGGGGGGGGEGGEGGGEGGGWKGSLPLPTRRWSGQ